MLTGLIGLGGTRARKLNDILQSARDPHEIASLQRRVFAEGQRRRMLAPGVVSSLGDALPFHPRLAAMRAEVDDRQLHPLTSAWEMRTYMSDVLLRDSDVMSMRHSLELRVPFVDRPLVEWLSRAGPALPIYPQATQGYPRRGDCRHSPAGPPDPKEARIHVAVPDLDAKGPATVPGGCVLIRQHRPERAFLHQGGAGALDGIRLGRGGPRLVARVERGGTHRLCEPPAGPPNADLIRVNSLLIAPEVFQTEGGIARILRLYLKALCETSIPGDSVRFISLNDPVFDPTGLRRYSDGPLAEWRVCDRRKRDFVSAALRMGRKSDRILCGHVAQLPVAWAASLLRPGLRYYLIAHGIEVWRPFSFLERRAIKGAHRILCVSEFTRQQILKFGGIAEERAVVLPNALDPYMVPPAPKPLPAGPPVILAVSRLSQADNYKGIDHLIAAMPSVTARLPGTMLKIVGRGDGLPFHQAQVRKLKLEDSVEVLGYRTDAELLGDFERCRLFALPSEKEGFGLVYLEAMAHGRPCLGARAGACPRSSRQNRGC